VNQPEQPIEQPHRWKAYKKGIVAGGGGVIVAGMAALDATGILTAYPAVSAVVSVVTAMGVYGVRNEPYTIPHPKAPPVPTYKAPGGPSA
jgi:hypothetical protein